MSNSTSQQEVAIGQRERAFDLQKQICVEITRGLLHLNRQLQLADLSQKFRIGQQITAAEIRLREARECFENVTSELREAYSWRGGAVPLVDTRIEVETKAPVVEQEDEFSRQFRWEAALQKVQDDAIPFSTKLATSTAFALEQIFKNRLEPVVAEPATLPEKIAACELKINRVQSEIDYASELLRPVRLAQSASRLGELRAEKSPEVQFAEEQLTTKKGNLAQLIAQHQALLAERQSQRGFSKTAHS